MGLFNKIFSPNNEENNIDFTIKEQNGQINKQEMIQVYGHELKIENSDKVVHILNIEQGKKFEHSDGRICEAYIAKAILHRENDTFTPDFGDDICFEVEENIIINHELLDNVAKQYLLNKDNKQTRVYLGEIEQKRDTNNLLNKYIYGTKSQSVNQWFERYIEKKDEIEKIKWEENANKREEEFRESFIFMKEAKGIKQKRNSIIKKRLNKPYLKLTTKGTTPSNKKIEEYEGVNVSYGNNRGDILRIIGLEKIGRDGSGTYLYSGHLQNAHNPDDAYIFDYDTLDSYGGMTPVCFELYRSLEDIVKEQNPKEIIELLKFLSNPQNFRNNKIPKLYRTS